MSDGVLDIAPYLRKVKDLAAFTGVEMKQVIEQEARLFVFNPGNIPGIIQITAPFSERARDNTSALAAGRNMVRRDFGNVFAPVSIKGQRTIKKAFGKRLAKPVTVATRERDVDVRAIYKTRWKAKNEERSKVTRRGRKGAYYVDEQKLVTTLREAYALIGIACACWWVAAMESGLKLRGVPPWIQRHKGAPGAGTIATTSDTILITLSSSLNYNARLGMQTKVRRVLGYRQNALQRRLPYVVAAAARKAKLLAA